MTLNRRQFGIAAGAFSVAAALGAPDAVTGQERAPWYIRARRWGHTNISYRDFADYDVAFWRSYWKRTQIDAVICNGYAGVAAFRSDNPLLERSPFGPDRDLLGELSQAAHADGLSIACRMDSGAVRPKVREAYAQWQIKNRDGQPTGAMCVNSPFRRTFYFPMFKEILDRYRVHGFTDNGGLGGTALCYCDFCRARWDKERGGPLPAAVNNADPIYRRWKRWNTSVIMSSWDETQAYLRSIGGEDCLYVGYARKGSPLNREIAARSPIVMMDMQSRNDAGSYHELVDEGHYTRSMLGWEKPIAVITGIYHHSHGYFRLTSDAAVEGRMYTKSAAAAGVNVWWHTSTAYSPDRRILETVPPVFAWHKQHEQYFGGVPLACVGVVRSDDDNTFFSRPNRSGGETETGGFGGPEGAEGASLLRGVIHALSENRVPFYSINMADFTRHAKDLPAIFLPDVNCLSDADCEAIRAYVRGGGGLVVTGMTSLYTEDGEQRANLALADVLGCSLTGAIPERTVYERGSAHSYLRLAASSGARHPALAGFDDVDVLAFGGLPVRLRVAADRQVLAHYAEVQTDGRLGAAQPDAPAVIVGAYGRGRVAYAPVDIDRRYAHDRIAEHAQLLSGLVRWCAAGTVPVEVNGPGYIGAYLKAQEGGRRHVLHLVNGSGVDAGDEITDVTYPVGPLNLKVRAPVGFKGQVRLLNADRRVSARVRDGMAEFQVARLDDYEIAVLE